MRYIICNPKGKPLDSFFPNDLTGHTQLHFSAKRYMIFGSIEEAETHIGYIQYKASGKSRSAAQMLRVQVDS